MSTTTTNYALVKPELTDAADITAMNENWDKLDTQLKSGDTALYKHINNKSNPHSVTKSQIGLGNVDNTSDANKPVSNAVSAALNGKVNKSGDTLTGVLSFQNKNAYDAIGKFRTINNVDYYVDFGCGKIGGKGCVSLQYMEGNAVKGRLEVSTSGVSFYDKTGKRTYLCRNTVVSATVE